MPACNCTAPCNCAVDEDGFFALRPSDGRRNTVVSGFGSPADPLVFQFQNSEFYRAPAGEKRAENVTLGSGSGRYLEENTDVVVTAYETPGSVFIPVPNSDALAVMRQRYHISGAAAKFATNSTGVRSIHIISTPPDLTVFLDNLAIAGHTSASSSTNNMYLSCSGYSPGVHVTDPIVPGIGDRRFNLWGILIQQSSGGDLNLEYVKFWVVTI